MFLEFIVWGAWAVTMGSYLNKIGFSGLDIGSAYSTTAIAAIVSPFFIGMIADRFFPAQIVLGVMHLLGAALMYWTSTITTPGRFFWALLGYALCYMPTLALVNAVSFHQMDNPSKQFPAVRVFGTLGWIVIGQIIGFMGLDSTVIPLQIAVACSVVMGVYSFTLPNTPPKGKHLHTSVSDILGLKTLTLMKDRSFAIFVIGSFLISIPLAFYYNFTNMYMTELHWSAVAAKQSLGQVSEVGFMLLMPFLLVRIGTKWMLLLGMIAWTVRYVFFAYGGVGTLPLEGMLYLGILLHGVCYDFFFVTGQLYVDRRAPEEVRANAQGFIGLVTYGAGMFVGAFVSGKIVDMYKIGENLHNWRTIYLIPAGMAFVIVVLFLLLFNDNSDAKQQA
jgi:nucleoside transporter